jgi:hypothetical protein
MNIHINQHHAACQKALDKLFSKLEAAQDKFTESAIVAKSITLTQLPTPEGDKPYIVSAHARVTVHFVASDTDYSITEVPPIEEVPHYAKKQQFRRQVEEQGENHVCETDA